MEGGRARCVVYMADAVGTQTEALVIRGLSVGVPIGSVVRRELLTGVVVGIAIAGAFLPIGLVGWGDADLAIAVALSLLAACCTATLAAMVLPWLFDRLGADPAFRQRAARHRRPGSPVADHLLHRGFGPGRLKVVTFGPGRVRRRGRR